jgi:hypothetical protein
MHPSVWRDTWSIFKFNIQGLGNSALWNGLATSPASPPYDTDQWVYYAHGVCFDDTWSFRNCIAEQGCKGNDQICFNFLTLKVLKVHACTDYLLSIWMHWKLDVDHWSPAPATYMLEAMLNKPSPKYKNIVIAKNYFESKVMFYDFLP